METLYRVTKNNTGADCGSDHELLIAKFKLKLKKIGETTRPFKYDLNAVTKEELKRLLMKVKEESEKAGLNSVKKLRSVHIVKAMFFPVVMYGGESLIMKKAAWGRTDAFEFWCWRKFLRVP